MRKFITLFFLLACTVAGAADISDQLLLLEETKQDIGTAITAKGQSVTGLPFTRYDEAIASITTGGIATADALFVAGTLTDWTVGRPGSPASFHQDLPEIASAITNVDNATINKYNAAKGAFWTAANLTGFEPPDYVVGTPAASGTSTPRGAVFTGGGLFSSAVILPNGSTDAGVASSANTVCIVPMGKANFYLYNWSDHSYAVGAAHGEPGSPLFIASALLPNQEVFCLPYTLNHAGLYDWRSDSYRAGDDTEATDYYYCGCLLMPDARIFMWPQLGTTLGIYSPDYSGGGVGTYTQGPACADFYRSATVIRDGRVILAGGTSDYVGVYTPDYAGGGIGTYFRAAIASATDYAYSEVVELKDGRILLTPGKSNAFGIFTPPAFGEVASGSFAVDVTFSESSGFGGANIDGRGNILCFPATSDRIVVYTPNFSGSSGSASQVLVKVYTKTSSAFQDSILLPNGNTLLVPYDHTYIEEYSNAYYPIPLDVAVHPILNKK